jgi:hypothetical protein
MRSGYVEKAAGEKVPFRSEIQAFERVIRRPIYTRMD